MNTPEKTHRSQILIFLLVAYALPFALGILMGVGYYNGLDVSVFPSAQMYYPAAGVMLAALLTRRGDALLPRRFFIGFMAATALMMVCAVASILLPGIAWGIYSQYVLMAASVVCLVLLLTEKKAKRIAYGLKGRRWGATALLVLLYIALYFGRAAIGYVISGDIHTLLAIAGSPNTWLMMAYLALNYFLVFTAFLGEEYGWRYYLQPVLQKRFGMAGGILLLGIVWGLWHLPINFFYYTSPAIGLISVAGQLVTCITLGAFFGWAYLMTDNIWVVVILHFANNNLVPVVTGTYSADVLQNQQMTWGTVLYSLVVNGILFLWVLFTKVYRDKSLRLPTMDERADACGQAAAQQEAETAQ